MRKFGIAAAGLLAAVIGAPLVADAATFRFWEYEFYYDAAKTQVAGGGYGKCGMTSEIITADWGATTPYYKRIAWGGECVDGVPYWY